MATVVNLPRDTRTDVAGSGLGALATYFYLRRQQDEIDKQAEEAARQIASAPDYNAAIEILNTQHPKVLASRGNQLRQQVQDKYPEYKSASGFNESGQPQTVFYNPHGDPTQAIQRAGVTLKGPTPSWGVEINGTLQTAPNEQEATKIAEQAKTSGKTARIISPPELDPALELEKIQSTIDAARIQAAAKGREGGTKDWEAELQARFQVEAMADPIVAKNGPAGSKVLVDTAPQIDNHFKSIYGTLGAGGVIFQSPGKDRQYQVAKTVASKVIARGGSATGALEFGKTAADLEIMNSMLDATGPEEIATLSTDKTKIQTAMSQKFGLDLKTLITAKTTSESAGLPEYDPLDPSTLHKYPLADANKKIIGYLQFAIVDGKFVPIQRLNANE